MWASLIGGAISATGSIFGGLKASEAMKQVKENIEAQKEKNQNWYDRRYNEDATQRADAQRILTKTEENIRNRNRASAGTQAVMGGTEESLQATKASNNSALAEAASQIAVASDARKDRIEEQYQNQDNQLTNSLNQMEVNKANAIAQAVKGVTSMGSSLASTDFGGGNKKS